MDIQVKKLEIANNILTRENKKLKLRVRKRSKRVTMDKSPASSKKLLTGHKRSKSSYSA